MNSYYPDSMVIQHRTDLPLGVIFTVGSNIQGRHGKGAALRARRQFGAIYGQGVGLSGQSYLIPTKDEFLNPYPLKVIARYILEFTVFTNMNPEYVFFVTRVGCGLSKHNDSDIAPHFRGADNCIFPESWKQYLE